MGLTINGEPITCFESVEWVQRPALEKPEKPAITFPTTYKIKMDLDPETYEKFTEDIAAMFKPEWFVIELEGVVIGRMRNIEDLGYDEFGIGNQYKAEFEPAEAFKEFYKGDASPMELNAVIFSFDAAGRCRQIHFVKEG